MGIKPCWSMNGGSGSCSGGGGANVDDLLHLPASIDKTGGADWWGPADDRATCYSWSTALAMTKKRLYFSSFFVPRQLKLLGGFVSLYVASTNAGAVLRAGIYKLGAPAGNKWQLGDLVADFGTLPADTSGNKIFDLPAPVIVQPGWYATVVGVSGKDAKLSYGRVLQPGCCRVYPYSTGGASRPRVAAFSSFLHLPNQNAAITGGLPTSLPSVNCAETSNGYSYMMMFPKWRLM